MEYKFYQTVENHLPKSIIICKVVGWVLTTYEGDETMYRLCDIRDYNRLNGNVEKLISENLTWAAPKKNILPHDEAECYICQG